MKPPMTITADIAKSLTAAGIGLIYHSRTLSDYGDLGAGYSEWVVQNGPDLKLHGGLVILHGTDQHEELRMLARAFHLNGAGVRIKSMTQMHTTFKYGGERLEEMNDAPVLMVSPAQAGRHGCPLDHYDMDHLTTYLRTRVENGQIVMLHWDHDRDIRDTDPLYQWWNDGFLGWIRKVGTVVTRAQIETRGKQIRSTK